MTVPLSIFDIFKIGVGPSSSHTMGPWRAAQQFLAKCRDLGIFDRIGSIFVEVCGSLAKTGRGHGVDLAVMMGLSGEDPVLCDTTQLHAKLQAIRDTTQLNLAGSKPIRFDPALDLIFKPHLRLPYHPNGLTFSAVLDDGTRHAETYYSTGGGFVEQEVGSTPAALVSCPRVPLPFETAEELLRHCRAGLSIAEVVHQNETTWRSADQIHCELQRIWQTMRQCIYRGCHTEGILPGGLGVVRRAAKLNGSLLGNIRCDTLEQWEQAVAKTPRDISRMLRWVSCFAMAVNEENAAFGRVVTAPTNGAAGVVPAVLMYCRSFCDRAGEAALVHEPFLLAAAAVASLFKHRATISGAVGGCQAEIGVASAVAAAGLAQSLGGTPQQTLMAAEIAMEHHLGLTCDPVGGLVQIPCIERNAMGAIKAITACTLALAGQPTDAKVSLDAVIRAMRETGRDMDGRYKETAEGGLALQVAVNLCEY